MTVYGYPRLVSAYVLLLRSRLIWAAAVCSALGLAVVSLTVGQTWAPANVSRTLSASLIAVAFLQVVTALAVKPWRRLPLAVGIDNEGVRLYGRMNPYQWVRWEQILAVTEGRPSGWLAAFPLFGMRSVARVDYDGTGAEHFYVLPSLKEYAEAWSFLSKHAPSPEPAWLVFEVSAGYKVLLILFGAGLLWMAATVFTHRDRAERIPAFVIAWLAVILVVVISGLATLAISVRFGPGWIEVRTPLLKRCFPDAELRAPRPWPVGRSTMLRWRRGFAFVSPSVFDAYGQILSEINNRLSGHQHSAQ